MKIAPLRAGLIGLFSQNLILMGVFFTIPLYLQLVVGLDALETGLQMLPISIAMFIASAAGSWLSGRFPVRSIVRVGLATAAVATVMLLAAIEPELNNPSFLWSMAVLGVGMGLIASQLGNVVQSSVDASGRGEAGGLQFTGQQLGSSLGVALLGAVVLSGLTTAFVSNVSEDERISSAVSEQVGVAVGSGIDFVSADQIGAAAQEAGLDERDRRGARRRLRVGAAASAQDRAPRSGIPGSALPGVHEGPAAPGAQQAPGPGQDPGWRRLKSGAGAPRLRASEDPGRAGRCGVRLGQRGDRLVGVEPARVGDDPELGARRPARADGRGRHDGRRTPSGTP